MSWLENVRVGDTVIVKTHREFGHIAKAEAVHKLHIVVGGRKYSKRNGSAVGSSGWDSPYLSEATSDEVTSIRLRNAAIKIITLSLSQLEKMPLAELESFCARVEEVNR